MVTKAEVNEFLSQKSLAVVGVSSKAEKFGNAVVKELERMGYRVFPVHPSGGVIDGKTTYASLAGLPEAVGGVVVAVNPAKTEDVLREAHAAGIRHVWIQQGAESEAAINFGQQNGMKVIHHQCLLMFAEPQLKFHKFHRWINGVLGQNPR